MSELTDKARQAASDADTAPGGSAAVGYLIEAIKALCDELEAHQHSYYGPSGMAGQWLNTQSERHVESASQLAYMQQMADKKKAKG
jgi:hypothetical protein